MTNPDPRPTTAPTIDPIAKIERLLTDHRSLPGGRCASCGKPAGMTTTRHRATAVYNRLDQARLLRRMSVG